MASKILELQVPAITWHSNGDEDSFFRWLYSIEGYLDCKGRGEVLCVRFPLDGVDRGSLQELVALFRRYDVTNRKQLRPFSESRHGSWFSSPERCWHGEVFSD